VSSLSLWERVEVRGYGISQELRPLTRAELVPGRRKAPIRVRDFSPLGRGELSGLQIDPN